MSARLTTISVRDDRRVIGVSQWGTLSRADAIAAFRRHYESVRAEADSALAASDAELLVETHTGQWVRRDVREVTA